MKKIFFTICLSVISCVAMAQQSVTTYSIYDTNHSGDLTVSDVTEVVDNVSNNVSPDNTQQHVVADDLSVLLKNLNHKLQGLESLENHLLAIEDKIKEADTAFPHFEDITIEGETFHLGVSGAIDLGLSVKWAAFNIGAETPGDYGDYFSWGETEMYCIKGHSQDNPCSNWRGVSKSEGYWWPSYSWYSGGLSDVQIKMIKYCNNQTYGMVDNITVLEPDDDTACSKWHGEWRMPTGDEMSELANGCRWIWTTCNGHAGCLAVGTNGNAIFMPVAGYRYQEHLAFFNERGYYWTSSLYQDNRAAHSLEIIKINDTLSVSETFNARSFGLPIRPVCP